MGDRISSKLLGMGFDTRALEQWNLKILGVEARDRAILLETRSGVKCLRVFDPPESRVRTIFSLLEHLAQKGFRSIPRFIRTRYGDPYVKTGRGCYYSISDWFIGRPLNYADDRELTCASEQMACLHLASRGFSLSQLSTGQDSFSDWQDEFYPVAQTMLDMIRETRYHPALKPYLWDMADRMLRSLRLLNQSGYGAIRAKACLDQGFCHGAFNSEHLLLGYRGQIFVAGFKNWRRDIWSWEIARFLVDAAGEAGWSSELIRRVIQSYDRVNPLLPAEWESLRAYLLFPLGSWQCFLELTRQENAPGVIAAALESKEEQEAWKERCLLSCSE